jgi:hypothetical protein
MRRFSAITRVLTASMKIVVISKAFSVSRVTIRLKNVIFSDFNYSFFGLSAIWSLR